MFNIVLFEPEIPPNTGNIIRLCSNIGARLHLIEPLGFKLDEKSLRRAGLDYRESMNLETYTNWQDFVSRCQPETLLAFSTKGEKTYSKRAYRVGDYLLFGPETRGLPDSVRSASAVSEVLTIPMQNSSRSLNLSNSVAVVSYEAWRQNGFHTGEHDIQ